MSEQPEDPQLDETTTDAPVAEGAAAATTGIDKAAVAAQAKAEAPAVEPDDTSGAPATAGDDEGTGEPPAPEESPATAPDESAAPAVQRPAKPAPRRKRDQAPPGGGAPVEVRAQAKYVRTSARKARLVCDHIRGKSVEEARAILAMTPRSVAEDWQKLLESAVANAEHNHELVGDELKVLAVYADEGPTLKRFRPRAMGRATPIRKRTSHLTIQLTPKER
jgi:ribosomal protein L22